MIKGVTDRKEEIEEKTPMKRFRSLLILFILVGIMLIPSSATAVPDCVTVEVGGHVAGNCVWTDYWTCCDGYCFAWSLAVYCA